MKLAAFVLGTALFVAGAGPPIAGAVLYHYALPGLGEPPRPRPRDLPPFAVVAFWLGSGEHLPLDVAPLSPWRYGWALAYARESLDAPRPGEHMAVLAARSWLGGRAPARGLSRGLRFWAAMVWASRHWDAAEMTQVWMDGAWFGRGAYGIEAASSAYFGKEPRHLAVDELALLVALTRSPSSLRPECDPERAWSARNRLLRELLGSGVITPADHALAAGRPLGVLLRACR